jgi:hypothetical protein
MVTEYIIDDANIFEVHLAVSTKIMVICVATTYSLVTPHRRFGGEHHFYHQDHRVNETGIYHYADRLLTVNFSFGLLLHPEDGDDILLRKVKRISV